MRVILLKDVKKLGRAGEVHDVSDGFARNFLLQRRLAGPATELADADAKTQTARQNKLAAVKGETARAFLDKISAKTFHFTLPADKTGHLYAGLKESEILAKIRQEADAPSGPLIIAGFAPIKTAGEHKITIEIPQIGARQTKVHIKPS